MTEQFPEPDDPPVGCMWRVVCHPSHVLTYFPVPDLGPCDQPIVVNMRHHLTDPCMFGIVHGEDANLYEDRDPNFKIGDCCAPVVVLRS